jgi:hypothetical protein
MDLQLRDRIVDETSWYGVSGRSYTTAVGKRARPRQAVDLDVTMIRTYGAHERVSVKRTTAEEDKR